MVNIPMLRKGVEWVEAEAKRPWRDREWRQSRWSSNTRIPDPFLDGERRAKGDQPLAECGTTYCLAGYLASLHGWVPEPNNTEDTEDRFTRDGEVRSVRDVAEEILGIPEHQSHLLFFGSATAQDIREHAEILAGERL